MIPAADRYEDSATDDLSSDPNEFELLIEKADQVRRALDELSSLREAALASAEHDAQQIRDEAEGEAREVRAEAENKARETLDHAHETAAEMLRAVRAEMQQHIDTATKRKTALDTTLAALYKMADVLNPPSSDDSPIDPGESLPARTTGLIVASEETHEVEESDPPGRASLFDDARSEAYAPLDFESGERP